MTPRERVLALVPMARMTVLAICNGLGAAVFTKDDREAICEAAEIGDVRVPPQPFLHPMVRKA